MKQYKKILNFTLLFTILMTALTSYIVLAEEVPTARRQKFKRGFGNVLFGPTEIGIHMEETAKEHGRFEAMTDGLARGVGLAIARIGTGVYEIFSTHATTSREYSPLIKPAKPAAIARYDANHR